MNKAQSRSDYRLAEELVAEQNLPAAVAAGAVTSLLAAAAYGITAAVWPFSHGFAAAGIGLVTGLSIGFLGRGISMKFAVVAVVFTAAGCVLGAVSRVIMELALSTAKSPIDIARENSFSMLTDRAVADVGLVDPVYWFVAVFCAAFFARRPLSRAERLAIHQFERSGEAPPAEQPRKGASN